MLRNSTVRGNSGFYGGGIDNAGTLRVQDTTISDNSGTVGGGIYTSGAALVIEDSTVSGNSAPTSSGGGIFVFSGSLTMQNSTVSGNSARRGGGIDGHPGVTIINCTISGNSAKISHGGMPGRPASLVRNSIIAGNTAPEYPNVNQTVPHNHSITDGTAAAVGLEVASTGKPLLKDNGGPTPTIALVAGSPAINTGDDTTAPTTDQRGYGRNGVSDMGSFEFSGVPPLAFRVDAMIKQATEAPSAYGLDNIYQQSPIRAQIEEQSVSTGGAAVYQVKVQNDTSDRRTICVRASEDAGTGWVVVYKRGSTTLTSALKSVGGYTTGTLAPGASEIITVRMPATTAPSGASKSVVLRVFQGRTDKVTRDAVKAVTTVAASNPSS